MVAKVVDRDASAIRSGATPLAVSTFSTAAPMPMARSCRVVNALALAITSSSSRIRTASV